MFKMHHKNFRFNYFQRERVQEVEDKQFVLEKELDEKKLTDFKAIYICPDHNDKYHARKVHMQQLLEKIGFKEIEHYKSGNEKYPECLSLATIKILENNLDIPFILFEDDIEFNNLYDIDINNEIDAIYLGISKWGGHPYNNIHSGESKFQKFNGEMVRVLNCLTAHAILYNRKRYKEAVIELLKKNYKNCVNDVLFSRIQKDFNILAYKKPYFYQSKKYNPHIQDIEIWTNFQIKD